MAKTVAGVGIGVNLSPEPVWTAANAERIKRGFGLGRASADARPNLCGRRILKCCAEQEEVGKTIAVLLSDAASFITGDDIGSIVDIQPRKPFQRRGG